MVFKNTVISRENVEGYMPRYISQRDKYNCGPVAVVNYWKYLGFRATYQDVKVLSKILGTEKFPIGTYITTLAAILGTTWEDGSLKKLRLPAIIQDGNHFWFCTYKCNSGFIGINYCDHETYHIISTRRMKSILKNQELYY